MSLLLNKVASTPSGTTTVCTGPWLDSHADELGVLVVVQRKVQIWFTPKADAFDASRCPAFLVDRAAFIETFYGFPDLGDGVKAAFHTGGAITSMDRIDRVVSTDDVAPIRAALETWMPGAGDVSAAQPSVSTR